MTIKPDVIGSHGKARILSYGHDYEIPIPMPKDGFVKSEYHWDEKLGLIREPYPLSPEEQQVEAARVAKEEFEVEMPGVLLECLKKVEDLMSAMASVTTNLDTTMSKVKELEDANIGTK